MPPAAAIPSFRALEAWVAIHGLPAMLKLDGRTGGQDVIRLADRANLGTAYASMMLRGSRLRSLWNAAKLRDAESILSDFPDRRPALSVQAYVPGRPANCAVACWRGEIVGFVAVEAVRTQTPFGIATVVRRVEGRAMRAAAESIVRHLGISGMCGFDFVIDDRTGQPTLIEINPRATQINHFPLGPEGDLSSALMRALGGRPVEAPSRTLPLEAEIALFPQEWLRDPKSPYLVSAFHDVPYEEPELLRRSGYESSPAKAAAIPANPPSLREAGAASPVGGAAHGPGAR